MTAFNFRLPSEMQLPRTDRMFIGCRVEKPLALKLKKIATTSKIHFDQMLRSILEDYIRFYDANHNN